MLRTVDFGTIRIVEIESIDPRFDVFVGFDLIGEWAYWQMPDGEIVAVEMVDLHARRTQTNPRLIDEVVAVAHAGEILHHRVVGVHVGLGLEILCPRRFNLVNTSPCDGKEPPILRAVELG